MDGLQNDMSHDDSVSAKPIVVASWRGRFNIPKRNIDINIAAHISNKACMKVWEVAIIMPESLCLEMIPRNDVWPASFKSSQPTEHSVALFFFSEGRDEEVLDSLMSDAICNDFALKAMVGKSELLIFTSLQLPQKLHRFQGKFYMWGVFREKEASSSHQSDYQVYVQNSGSGQSLSSNSGNTRSFEGKGSPINIFSKDSHLTHTVKADKRGRRLDDSWEHAKPLDELRQKAECKYCGFVSLHGGISRLKAHLAGGNSRIHLPGCDKVSPEVKKFMSNWFSAWLKNTKALWTKEIKEPAAYVHISARPHDISWNHAKPLDIPGRKTETKEYGFTSLHEGISCLKVHLDGEDAEKHVAGHRARPRMSPTIKEVTSKWVKSSTVSTSSTTKGAMYEWVKNSSASKMKKKSQEGGAEADNRGRTLDDAWEHAKPLDVARQKTQCNYCGFISTYGGISRLKAHLGGECPQLLQGCPKVSPQVKSVMEQWFNEWAQNSKAIWIRKSPCADGAEADNRGRRLDHAWEHAKPLDEARQKTRCNYCGFVSTYGGISRLKAHLGGGHPQLQLQGCTKVSLQVKSVMEEWFNEWAQTSKAIWLKKYPRGKPPETSASAKTFKRGRPLDDTWEHAIPLDEMRQSAKCKYCDFVSKHGGVARMKVHLGGGDPTSKIQGCPNVSPEVKSLMAKDINEFSKKSKGATVETVQEVLQEAERTESKAQWFEKRHHILQETLDEITNTSLKESLRKLIDEKNSELQKMQFEIQYLESRLASLP
ncbi:hypothetical protein BUALT_Bualt08G0106000 [Buddleja alternifolia]|uniref:BED-type domain-containing protein n=1 Tax=Buddleja alternifolia TaxID=168488 RepID=A0AAV6X6W2_9LAMI|nr:hypothetical protein BUALT_Bualt08G0106000 [Buddleja alternifolia]